VIGADGNQVGILKIEDALRMAQERDLDLVEVAPEARPPVCRILDYSKYKYEQAQKLKAARKHQQQINVREIKFRPKIAEHDYATKKGHVTRFLLHKDKVKITIMFRGREVTHPERGQMLLERLAEDLAELAQIDQRPNLDGRNMTMLLAPSKAVLAGEFDKNGPVAPAADADGAEAQAPEAEAPVTEAPEADAAEAVEAETPEAQAPAAEAAAVDEPDEPDADALQAAAPAANGAEPDAPEAEDAPAPADAPAAP